MKILHTADWHLGDRLGRIDRTLDLRKGVERVAAYCEETRADLLLMAGDLFSELSRADGLRETLRHLRDVFLPFLRQGGTILAITGNHDNENLCHTLCSAISLAAPADCHPEADLSPGRLYLAAEPAAVRLADRAGNRVQFLLMPYPTGRAYLDEPGQRFQSLEEKNQNLREAFGRKLRDLQSGPAFRRDIPTVLAAHVHAHGARLSRPYRVNEQDNIVFPDADLADGFAYTALGHIHQPQALRGLPHVRYSGSIERLDLGERQDEKSLTLIEVGPAGLLAAPVCLPLPATPFAEVVITDPSRELPLLKEGFPNPDQTLVRLDVTYTAGRDNLDAVLRELDRLFPRWYARTWRESGALAPPVAPAGSPKDQDFPEIVLTYLGDELANDPDREPVLEAARQLLAEESA